MKFEALTDPVEFQRRTTAVLADEGRHNLIRGILGNLVEGEQRYEEFSLFLVSEGPDTRAAALMTRPYNLIVADTENQEALSALVSGLVAESVVVPGVIGNRPTVDSFALLWQSVTGESATVAMEQGVFSVDTVIPVAGVNGVARLAVVEDLDLVCRWLNEFIDEALPGEPRDDVRLREMTAKRLTVPGTSAVWLWEVDGTVVSTSSHASPTGSGIRIGGVYTPPQHRGNGYASAVVAAESQWLLDNGYKFCFLLTDLVNPTSNAIYERIGYKRIADGASFVFAASPGT